MTRTIAVCIVVVSIGIWLIFSAAAPEILSDRNSFLKQFVGVDMLSFLGVVVTITLASATNIHFELNKMEEKAGRSGFSQSRLRLRQSAFWLIATLFVSVALVIAKSLTGEGDTQTSLFNGAALIVIICDVLVLVDLTQMAFKITPNLKE